MAGVLENVATAAMTVAAAVLTTIAVVAWGHTRSRKVLMLAVGFGLFFVKGVILSVGLFTTTTWASALLPFSILFDLAILLLFYLAVLQRSGT